MRGCRKVYKTSGLGLALAWLIGTAMTGVPLCCSATAYTWFGGNGDWSVPANWTPSGGPPGSNDTANVNGGTVAVSTSTFVGTLNLATSAAGGLNGDGSLALLNAFNWSSGRLDGSGGTVIAAGATANISALDTTILARTLENRGTTTLSGDQHWSFDTGGAFNNVGGTFIITGNAIIQGPAGASFNNVPDASPGNSLVIVNAPGKSPQFNNVPFNDGGAMSFVKIQAGTLQLLGGGFHDGCEYTVPAGATLRLRDSCTFTSETALIGGGTLDLAGPQNATYDFGGQVNIGSINLSSPSAFFQDCTVGTLNLLNSGGVLYGDGQVTVTNTLNWLSGTMSGEGITTIASRATANIPGSGGTYVLVTTLLNAGTAVIGAPTAGLHWTFEPGGSFNNLPGGTCILSGFEHFEGGAGNSFNNAGTFTVDAAGDAPDFSGMVLNNTGSVDIHAGALNFAAGGQYLQTAGSMLLSGGSITNSQPLQFVGGTLHGAGVIAGSVSNNATISPGTSAGRLTITGNLSQTANGAMNIELGGTTPGTDFDRVDVGGTATLAGVLNVSLINGFSPALNAEFTFLTCASRSGIFNTFSFPSTDIGMQANYTATSASVQVVNTKPVVSPIANQTINEQALFSLAVNATDAEAPPQTLSYALINSPAGANVDGSGGISWTPTEAQGPMVTNITVVVTDNGTPNLSASRTFQVTVNEINVAPTLVLPAGQSVLEQTSFSANATATDSDIPTNSLAFELVSGPAGLTVSSNGAISWTPTEAQGPGINTVTIRVTDLNPSAVNAQQLSTTNSFTLVVNESNQPPVLTVPGTQTVAEQTLLTVTNSATDPDAPTNTLTFSLVNPPAGVSINSTSGVLTWLPSESQGPSTNTITVRVTDNNPQAVNTQQLSDTKSFTVIVTEVNRAPVLTPPPNATIDELALYTATATATDPDDPPQPLTFSLVSGPAGLTVSPTGQVSWTPTEAQGPGVYSVAIAVSDSSLSTTGSYMLTVNEVISGPTISDIPDQNLQQNSSTGPLPFTIGDAETPAQNLTLNGNSSNPGLVPNGNIVFGGSGSNRTVQVTPIAVAAGTATITVTVTDESNATASDTFVVAVRTSLGVNWFTMDGGGASSTNSALGLGITGTMGQPDAGRLSGATLGLNGGFWGVIAAVQTPGAPRLTISSTGPNALMVSWPSPSTGFLLQQNTALNVALWTTPPETVQDNGTVKFITINQPSGNRFFRLFRP
jgi:hypothetical protein